MGGYLFCTTSTPSIYALSVGQVVVAGGLCDLFICSFSYFYDIFYNSIFQMGERERERRIPSAEGRKEMQSWFQLIHD